MILTYPLSRVRREKEYFWCEFSNILYPKSVSIDPSQLTVLLCLCTPRAASGFIFSLLYRSCNSVLLQSNYFLNSVYCDFIATALLHYMAKYHFGAGEKNQLNCFPELNPDRPGRTSSENFQPKMGDIFLSPLWSRGKARALSLNYSL